MRMRRGHARARVLLPAAIVAAILASAAPSDASASVPVRGGAGAVTMWAGAGAAFAGALGLPSDASDPALAGWQWPVAPPRIVAPFVAPAHEYGPGHRGIDLAAAPGAEVHTPAAGTIAFVGRVAGRPLVTIDHGDGLVTTLEPVSATVTIGDAVAAGDVVGVTDAGGHTPPGAVHFGVRRNGAYINPMLLLGEVPRAVLLPCC